MSRYTSEVLSQSGKINICDQAVTGLAAPRISFGRALRSRAFWDELHREISSDRWLHITILSYFGAGQLLAIVMGSPDRLRPFMYLKGWLATVLCCLLGYLLFYRLPRAVLSEPRRPRMAIYNAILDMPLPRVIAGVLLLSALELFFGTFTSIKNILPSVIPFWFDPLLADMDEILHGGTAPWLLLQPFLGSHNTTRAIELIYMLPWSIIMTGTQVLVAVHPKMDHLRGQYYFSYLWSWIFLGSIVACIGMSAGPIYYGYVTGEHDRFSGLVEYLSFSSGLLSSAFDIRSYLWGAYQSQETWLSSGISAFPSMHVATTTLLVLVSWKMSRFLGLLMAAFWLVILVSSVHLGWHYAIDGYVSAVCTIAIWITVRRLRAI